MAVAPIDSSILVKGAEDAAVVVHDDVWILPFSAELDGGPAVRSKVAQERRPIVHVQIDLLSVGIGADPAPHSATEVHSEDFAAR